MEETGEELEENEESEKLEEIEPGQLDIEELAEWRSRPIAARLVRSTLLFVPLAAVTTAAWWINSALGPAANLTEALARWAVLSVVSTIVLIGVDRGAKRIRPLSTLLHMSIVAQISAHDRLTRGHTERVRAYTDMIAREMGLRRRRSKRSCTGAGSCTISGS